MAETQREHRDRRVTRDVELSAVGDLLEHPPRATVAFVDGDAVDLFPAQAYCRTETYAFGIEVTETPPDLENREVVLLIDDGPYWFELRGISVRGVAKRVDPPVQGGSSRLAWYAIDPRRFLAWDYGSIREE